MKKTNIAGYIDHTLLKATATDSQIKTLCREAKKHHFAAVCVNPCYVDLVKRNLKNSTVKICTVLGFPLGADLTESKVFQAKKAISRGADEIDMVINIGKLLSGDFKFVLNDIKEVRRACKNKILKVIIETAYLTDKLKIKACRLAKIAKADFVKTSTGFAPRGATTEDIKLMRRAVGAKMGIKASGGVRDYKTAAAMNRAGATRIGTSCGVEIIKTKDRLLT